MQLPRQTLARWIELVADWLWPVYEQIRSGMLAGGYVQVDETPIDYTLRKWEQLEVFQQDGRVELEQNLTTARSLCSTLISTDNRER